MVWKAAKVASPLAPDLTSALKRFCSSSGLKGVRESGITLNGVSGVVSSLVILNGHLSPPTGSLVFGMP